MKKLSLLLAAAMALNLSAGAITVPADELKDVYLFTCTFMDIPSSDDVERVTAKVNEIMNPLGVNVHLEYTNVATYDEEVSRRLAAGETIDLMNSMEWNFPSLISNGSILSLNDVYEEYGQDIQAALGDDFQSFLDALTKGGEIYGIPQLSAKHTFNDVLINKELADKYEMDLSTIDSYDDLEPFMLTIKENEPGVKPIIRSGITFSGTTAVCTFDENYEALGDGIGVLMDPDSYELVNFYATDEYAEFCKTVHRWYEEGLVSDDIATSGDRIHTYWQTGNAFACIDHTTDYSTETASSMLSAQYGVDTEMIRISTPICSNLIYFTTIPYTSENPDAAMIFLNEMYKNTDLINTLYYGVEGEDWDLVDGFITGKEDSTFFASCSSSQPMIWGNYFVSTEIAGNEEGAVQKTLEYTKSGKSTRSLGFLFDTSNVSTQYAAIQNVLQQYQEGLEFGILDPEVELPNFLQALEDAGVEEFIAEKQAQLDAWVAENK